MIEVIHVFSLRLFSMTAVPNTTIQDIVNTLSVCQYVVMPMTHDPVSGAGFQHRFAYHMRL